MALDNDGMDDLGNLPIRTRAIRNKRTGLVMLPEQARTMYDPSDEKAEDPWEFHVRYAYKHSDELELLDYIPGVEEPIKSRGGHNPDDESGIPTMANGKPMTAPALRALDFKTLTATAKNYEINPGGKSVTVLVKAILTKAYGEIGLPVPAMDDPTEGKDMPKERKASPIGKKKDDTNAADTKE